MNDFTILKGDIKKDKKEILSILERNLEGASLPRYEWNYEKCPYEKVQCFLARNNKSGSLVGTAALFPRKMIVNGELLYVGIGGDFAVDKKFRAFGPSFKLQREIQSKINDFGFRFIYGIPNELSRELFLRIGHKEIGKFERYLKILKTEFKAEHYLPLIDYFKFLSRIIDLFIEFFSTENKYKKKSKYTINIPEFFDERFDIFWKKVMSQFIIIGERTSNFLNWRYKQSSRQEYKIFCILNNEKEIRGYIVYYIKENMCHIVDMLFEKSEDVLDSLLMEFALFIRSKRIGSISVYYLGKGLLEKKLKEFNFHRVKKEEKYVTIYSNDLSSDSFLLNKKNWYFFEGDNDI